MDRQTGLVTLSSHDDDDDDDDILLAFFGCTLGGRRATLRASPNAPGNELLLRMTKLPGGLFLSKLIAGLNTTTNTGII